MALPPLVSVVIPTRDRWGMLRATLATVLAQRDVNLEVLVVDDGSDTDPAHFPADGRITLLRHETSSGVAEARNAGLAAARGPYVAFTDDDDLWAPDKLSAQLAAIERTGAAWASCGAVGVDDEMRIINNQRPSEHGDVGSRILATNVIPGGGSGVLADTALVRRVGGFDPAFHMVADWDLWIRLGLAAPLAAVDRPLLVYRLHAGGMSLRHDRTYAELRALEEKYAAERAAREVAMNWPRLEHWLADRKQRAGDRVGAARSFLRASKVIGRPRSISRAAEAFLWPDAQRFRDARWAHRVPAAWRDEVATWLAPEPGPAALRDAMTPASPTSGGADGRRPDPSRLGTG
ncbi:MAG: glycosyltransferase family 2 protein [Acidimicrobiales bacterium]|nr:glycosyltransferase family 2 protein [Acidimicrobiales bacterium]